MFYDLRLSHACALALSWGQIVLRVLGGLLLDLVVACSVGVLTPSTFLSSMLPVVR